MSRALTELFRAVEGGSLVLKVPGLGCSFEIDARSHLSRRILIEGSYEPEIVSLIKERLDPARDAIDIGANVGLFSVFLAKLLSPNGRVLSVEPTPGALRFLRRNLERNGCHAKVIVFEGAASSSRGEVTLRVISGKEEYSSMGSAIHPSVQNESYEFITAPSESVDDLVDKYCLLPGLIKVDAEGAEYEVLLGCERTMLASRPVILCERWDDGMLVQAGGVPGAVAKLLESRGYSVSCPFAGELLAIPL